VRLRPRLRAVLDTSGESPVLELPHRRLTLPPATAPAAGVVLRGEPVAVADLPGDPGSVTELVSLLLRTSVVVPADSSAAAPR